MLEQLGRDRTGTVEAGREAALWIAAVLAGAITTAAAPGTCLAVAGLGLVAAIIRRQPVVTALPVLAAGVLDLQLLPWAVAAAVVARAWWAPPAQPRLDSEPQRQLMRARRRDEQAALLVAGADSIGDRAARELVGLLRATDGIELVRRGDSCELRAVLDGEDVDREALERRIAALDGIAGLSVGWASFPADGFTLETLLEHARAGMRARHTTAVGESAAGVPVPAPSMARAS